jgi:hypothetical protein
VVPEVGPKLVGEVGPKSVGEVGGDGPHVTDMDSDTYAASKKSSGGDVGGDVVPDVGGEVGGEVDRDRDPIQEGHQNRKNDSDTLLEAEGSKSSSSTTEKSQAPGKVITMHGSKSIQEYDNLTPGTRRREHVSMVKGDISRLTLPWLPHREVRA